MDYKALVELPLVRNRAKQRIIASFDDTTKSKIERNEVEIASLPLAILYISIASDRRLTERFSLFEAKRINSHLQQEKRVDVILEVAKALKWDIKYGKNREIWVPFAKYLEKCSKGTIAA